MIKKEPPCFFVSSLEREGLGSLLESIVATITEKLNEDNVVVVQARHYEGLQKALEATQKAEKLLLQDESPEFVAFEIKGAVLELNRLLGLVYEDQIMDKVFNEFCLGK